MGGERSNHCAIPQPAPPSNSLSQQSSNICFILANAKSSAGLLEMPDIRSAMEALTLTNHFTINPPGNEVKLIFRRHLLLPWELGCGEGGLTKLAYRCVWFGYSWKGFQRLEITGTRTGTSSLTSLPLALCFSATRENQPILIVALATVLLH